MSSKFADVLDAAKEMGFDIPDKKKSGPTLEDALLFIDERCDGATSADSTGFNREDTDFGKAMASKAKAGEPFTPDEYHDVWQMLKKYSKNQLAPAGLDIRKIPKKQPRRDNYEVPEIIPPSEDELSAARKILETGDPIQAHVDYVNSKVHDQSKQARVIICAGYSTYLPADDRFHVDAVGSSQIGKSNCITSSLETFPEENVIVVSEASAKTLYYLAKEEPERLKGAIVYLDDAREEHIPVLKTFRNEGNITPCNMTVIDGEFMEMLVLYRPSIIASSVTPLRDPEQQAGSRAFLTPFPDVPPEIECKVHASIRRKIGLAGILPQEADDQVKIRRTMARILRDEGIKDVLVLFDAEEPEGADRRGTGQFMRLIKISAFVNQFQRPILELKDGRTFVLAIYEDLEMAARVWFDFAEGQRFKIPAKALDILKDIPDGETNAVTAPYLARKLTIAQRTVEQYLKDLFECGILSRQKLELPGSPWAFWCEPELRKKALSQISDTGDSDEESRRIAPDFFLRKYMAKNSSDSLKDSINRIFSNSARISQENVKAIFFHGKPLVGECPEIFLSYISQKPLRNSTEEFNDSEYLRKGDLSQLAQIPTDNDIETCENAANSCANTKNSFNTDYNSDWNGEMWIKRGIVESTLN